MNPRTQTQLLNAIAANKGPRVWLVMVSFGDTSNTYAVARNVTHREAKALARDVKERGGYVELIDARDSQ